MLTDPNLPLFIAGGLTVLVAIPLSGWWLERVIDSQFCLEDRLNALAEEQD